MLTFSDNSSLRMYLNKILHSLFSYDYLETHINQTYEFMPASTLVTRTLSKSESTTINIISYSAYLEHYTNIISNTYELWVHVGDNP